MKQEGKNTMIEEVRGGGGGVGLEHQRTSTDDRSNAREAGSGGVVNVKICKTGKKDRHSGGLQLGR